jgi:hypothetical protein
MRSATTHAIGTRRQTGVRPTVQPAAPRHAFIVWLDKLLTFLVSGLRDDAYIH